MRLMGNSPILFQLKGHSYNGVRVSLLTLTPLLKPLNFYAGIFDCMSYQPPFTLNNEILSLVAQISELVGRLTVQHEISREIRLRKVNQVRTIQGSLAIEGNQLTQEQITALINGKRVLAPKKQVQEAHNAIQVYEHLARWNPKQEPDLLAVHQQLMMGLQPSAGQYRNEGVGVFKNGQMIHMAPPAERVPNLIADLFDWLDEDQTHPLIQSSIFHYEFEFIHPFADGNGRMGRLWQTLLLAKWNPIFANLPVEGFVYDNQDAYYQAINQSSLETDCAPFVVYMLNMIKQALSEVEYSELTPKSPPKSPPKSSSCLMCWKQRCCVKKFRKSWV